MVTFLHCRYLSRCLLVEFKPPSIDIAMSSYSQLPPLLDQATSAIGLLISLGEAFSRRGIEEMDEKILPKLCSLIAGAIPRVLPYSFGSQ
jgi:hypothetical protein